jgi:hypothetical protein
VSIARYTRAPGVVWRLAGDRVLLRRVRAAGSPDDAADLFGVAAMVWVALDEPRAADEVAAEVTSAVGAVPPLDEALAELVAQGFVVEVPA